MIQKSHRVLTTWSPFSLWPVLRASWSNWTFQVSSRKIHFWQAVISQKELSGVESLSGSITSPGWACTFWSLAQWEQLYQLTKINNGGGEGQVQGKSAKEQKEGRRSSLTTSTYPPWNARSGTCSLFCRLINIQRNVIRHPHAQISRRQDGASLEAFDNQQLHSRV